MNSENRLPPYPSGHQFYGPFVEETLTEGWCYGAITEYLDPDGRGCESGDGFVVAPDGSYCGLVWWTGCPWDVERIAGPRRTNFWGTFEVRFSKTILTIEDLVDNFREVLPSLQAFRASWQDPIRNGA